VSNFVSFLVSVGGFATLMLAGCVWMFLKPRARQPQFFLFAVALVYCLASTYVTSYVVTQLLSIGYRPLTSALDSKPCAVVVLGSGSITARDWEQGRFSVVDQPASARVLEAARVYHLVQPDWVISSGGRTNNDNLREPSGNTMRDALVLLGVPAERILVETESRTTRGEAVIVKPMLERLQVKRVILVTSPSHMRRSVGAFRAVGIETEPAIARDAQADAPWRDWLFPSDTGLKQANAVAHEILGIAYYALRGWYK
jgi:uncharacterized SAM-binding protein YcdF (DUF218 family)